MTSIAIVAGEVSGDYLAAGLIEELRKLIPGVSFFGIAGPKMIEAGCQMIFPQEKLAVIPWKFLGLFNFPGFGHVAGLSGWGCGNDTAAARSRPHRRPRSGRLAR